MCDWTELGEEIEKTTRWSLQFRFSSFSPILDKKSKLRFRFESHPETIPNS